MSELIALFAELRADIDSEPFAHEQAWAEFEASAAPSVVTAEVSGGAL